MSNKSGRSATASVLAVGVLQIIVFVITTAVWVGNTIFAGGACADHCDWAGAERAGMIYYGIAALMLLCTAAAALFAWRTQKAHSWVPLAASAGTVAGLLFALHLFQDSMAS